MRSPPELVGTMKDTILGIFSLAHYCSIANVPYRSAQFLQKRGVSSRHQSGKYISLSLGSPNVAVVGPWSITITSSSGRAIKPLRMIRCRSVYLFLTHPARAESRPFMSSEILGKYTFSLTRTLIKPKPLLQEKTVLVHTAIHNLEGFFWV